MAEEEFRLCRSVVLVGLMGAGKTTVGTRLAQRLGVPFADTDLEVERTAGLGIAEIFEQRGEPAFRTLERDAVARLTANAPQVIAVGGGAFADQENRRELLERCIVVWLDADVPTLARRLAGKVDRPLLRGGDPEAMLARLAAQREPFHAEAPLRIDAGRPVEQVVDRILEALAGRCRALSPAPSRERDSPPRGGCRA